MIFKKYKEKILKDPRSSTLDFTPDGRTHYAYRVSRLLEVSHYYGSHTDISVDTIGTEYYTSSKYLEESFKANPENYKIKIIRRFDNPGDKILFESYLHQYFDVKSHDSFINRSNQTPFGFDTTGKQLGSEHPRARPVLKIDRYTGKILEEFETVIQAQRSINKGNISQVIRGVQFSADGYAWCYKEKYTDKLVQEIINREYNYKGIIYQLDRHTKEIIAEFTSIRDAIKAVGNYNIQNVINNRQPTAGGYDWCKKENYEQV